MAVLTVTAAPLTGWLAPATQDGALRLQPPPFISVAHAQGSNSFADSEAGISAYIRAGGTINGPTMFMLADTALYVAVLSSVGPKALAVTTNMSINFLRKPAPKDMIAECRLLKLGKRLAVGEVFIYSDGEEAEAVAHATGAYAVPA